jgi:hypothetical protein
MRAGALALGAGASPAAPLGAESVPVPSQEDWSGRKQRIELPSGHTLAYVEMGDPEGPPLLLSTAIPTTAAAGRCSPRISPTAT